MIEPETDVELMIARIMAPQLEARAILWSKQDTRALATTECAALLECLQDAIAHPGETAFFPLRATSFGLRKMLDLQDALMTESPALSLSYPNVRYYCILVLMDELFRFYELDFYEEIPPAVLRPLLSWSLCRHGIRVLPKTLEKHLETSWRIYMAIKGTGHQMDLMYVRTMGASIKQMPDELFWSLSDGDSHNVLLTKSAPGFLVSFLRAVRIACVQGITDRARVRLIVEDCLNTWPDTLMNTGYPDKDSVGKYPFSALDVLWEAEGIPYTRSPWSINPMLRDFRDVLVHFIADGETELPVMETPDTPWQISWLIRISPRWLGRSLRYKDLGLLLDKTPRV